MAMDSLELIIQIAISREQEAFRFYEKVAGAASDPNLREVFEQLAREEREHERILWLGKGDASLDLRFKAPYDLKVAEGAEMPELSMEMKPADALQWAMKKEQQAAELYRCLADSSTGAEARSLYQNLANMELEHKHRLEILFVDKGFPEAW
jgi:rubrerythrin